MPAYYYESKTNYQIVIAGVEGAVSLLWFIGFVVAALLLRDRECWGEVCDALKISIGLGALQW